MNSQDQLIQKLRGELDAANQKIDYKDKQIANLEAKIKQLKEELRKKHEDWQNACDECKRLINDLETLNTTNHHLEMKIKDM